MKLLVVTMAALIAVLLQQADAIARLCINGDDEITDLYVDGVSLFDKLPNADSVKKCDCVELPPNSGVIAVEAKNVKQARGIQACNTASVAVYRDWVCRPARKNQGDDWYTTTFYDDNWKPAKQFDCVEHCRPYYKQPCNIAYTKCFWAHKVLPSLPSVRCRLKQCADGCTSCKTAGPGNCDPGKCKLGDGTNALTQKTSCNRVCLLDIKAWGKTGQTGEGYIRVIDNDTKSVDEWKANVAGDYLATVNMTTCTISDKHYNLWPENWDHNAVLLNTWIASESGSDYKYIIGVELAVGADDPTATEASSYAPFINVVELGVTALYSFYNDHYETLSAELKGVQNGPVTLSNAVLYPPNP